MIVTHYSRYCDNIECKKLLETEARINRNPDAVVCTTCGRTYTSRQVEMEFATHNYDKPNLALTPSQRIKRPISAAKRKQYNRLEAAERQRQARMSGEAD